MVEISYKQCIIAYNTNIILWIMSIHFSLHQLTANFKKWGVFLRVELTADSF